MNSENSHVFPRISNCDQVCIATNAPLLPQLQRNIFMNHNYGQDTVEKSQGYPIVTRLATNAALTSLCITIKKQTSDRYQIRCLAADSVSYFPFLVCVVSVWYLRPLRREQDIGKLLLTVDRQELTFGRIYICWNLLLDFDESIKNLSVDNLNGRSNSRQR
jgi:hypothetical protein